jgi:hypothetical protein
LTVRGNVRAARHRGEPGIALAFLSLGSPLDDVAAGEEERDMSKHLKHLIALGLCAAAVAAGACAGKDSSTGAAAAAGEPVAARPASGPAASPSLLERVGRLFRREPVVKEVAAGTTLAVRFIDSLSSETSDVGQGVRAEVTRPVTVDGVETIPAGSTAQGEVTLARPPKIGGRAQLAVRFTTLKLPSGAEVPIAAGASWAGKSEKAKDAGTIAGSVIGGAILGHQVDGGKGKVVGGILGGAAGTAIAHGTHGRPLVVPAGTAVELTLETAVRVEVEVP